MRVTSIEIANETIAPNGQRTITERIHFDNDNSALGQPYFAGPDWDVQAIAAQRMSAMNAELERREQEVAAANNFEIPLTPLEIQRRVTPAEWMAFEALTSPEAQYFKSIFKNSASLIHRADPLTQAARALLIAEGVLTTQRDAVVFA
jgi:hypothetical protein